MGRRLDLLARKRDGTEFPVEVSLSPFEARQDFHIIAAVRDVSDRRHVEDELRASERILREMVNSLPVGIAFADADQRYRFANIGYGRFFDLNAAQMVGRTAREVLGDETYAHVKPGIEAALLGKQQRSEVVFLAEDGSSMPVEVSHIPHFDENGEVVGYFAIGADISDRVNAQDADREHRETLAHFSRVATMGELAASIAHELNQPLAAITANAQAARRFLARTPPDVAEVDDALADVAGDAMRAASVIRHMRDLLRKGDRRKEMMDIVSLVKETVQMVHSDAVARNCSMTIQAEHDVPLLSGDPIQLKQVILNLVVNAFEAVSEEGAVSDENESDGASAAVGGSVSRGTGAFWGVGGPVRGGVRKENGVSGALTISTTSSNGWVDIRFSDNGPGFPGDVASDCFAPFVTTKPEGLGMGLSISRSIVEAHGGELVAESNPGGGAILRIILPVPADDVE